MMRILVVEDERESFRSTDFLPCDEGYFVDTTDNPEYGLLKSLYANYDVILLHVTLPGSEGWSVLKQLRRKDKHTPVLMLTACDMVNDRIRGLNWGADDCMALPVVPLELMARIRALIRRSAGSPQSLIDIGPVAINTVSRKVTIKGKSVSLTAKEFTLLELLATHRNEIVTREMIYEHLFDEFDPSLANLVDVYVSNIRRKIGYPLLTTCRGRGYIIAD